MLTLLHTNDFHNHLSEDQASHLRALRSSLECVLLLDAGDAVRSGNATYRPGGEEILERMSGIPYDAMAVGNREFHFTQAGFGAKLRRAGFPVLCSNVRSARSGARLPRGVNAHMVRDMPGGMRVVVFGLTVPMITERTLLRRVSAYVFDDPVETARRLAPRLRAELAPDVLVALTHVGIGVDRVLASEVPGIDVILGGHSHVTLDAGERVGHTLIAHAGAFGKALGRVQVARGSSAGAPLHVTATVENL